MDEDLPVHFIWVGLILHHGRTVGTHTFASNVFIALQVENIKNNLTEIMIKIIMESDTHTPTHHHISQMTRGQTVYMYNRAMLMYIEAKLLNYVIQSIWFLQISVE